MRSIIDLTGKRFGKLVVIGRIANIGGRVAWQCICDCGETYYVISKTLVNGQTTHCGCNHGNKKLAGEAVSNEIYDNIRRHAIARGYSFELTKDQYVLIANQPCFFCGKQPYAHYKKGRNGPFVANGLDRLNNDLGYTELNTVACCKECNIIKNGITPAMVSKLYHALIERGYLT